ncbi:MAG: ArsR family transcriptional regulator [Spirochaetes bacterium]|nr:ArsR family transcriptional regulator [Spirochaetota bacterium]
METGKSTNMLIIRPEQDIHILKGLASEIRLQILNCIITEPKNINAIADELGLPQSTVATNVQMLEKCGLISSRIIKGIKGNQKVCICEYTQYLVILEKDFQSPKDSVRVEMPIGLFIDYSVSPPCGMCSQTQIIGFLDSPEAFLEPDRVKAGLLWFEKGFVRYKFPNNAYNQKQNIRQLEISMELSSETPGTSLEWKSDISLLVNDHSLGIWTSPGDFGDKRGKFTPAWWKMEGSQYGIHVSWIVNKKGTFIGKQKVSDTRIDDLAINDHHSIKVEVGVDEQAEHVGGINIFGRGFGNYNQDIILELLF